MLSEASSVKLIPQIGPASLDLLAKLGIETVEDLLYHFPFRYQDYTKVLKISSLMSGQSATVFGEVLEIENVFTRNHKRFTKMVIGDDTGKIGVTWFNQPYLAKSLVPGTKLWISGEVGVFGTKIGFIGPDYEIYKDSASIHTGRLVPVYPETEGITSKWLRTRINFLLERNIKLSEKLPKEALHQNKLTELNMALKWIHFPENWGQISLARKRFAFEEVYELLLEGEEKRREWKTKRPVKLLKPFTKDLAGFYKSLPFTLTGTQSKAIEEILLDMVQETPMNRLLQGEVGSGKTVVACAASYLSFLNGCQTYFMAPTELLAFQHFATLKKFLEPLGVKVGLITGSQKHEGEFDVVVGTHALLNTDFKKVGLVIIDEQHRFGVKQRSKLLNLKDNKTPHLLTMTATPIPRTLALTLFADLDLSILEELPTGRQEITTWVVPKAKREKAYKWILDEIVNSEFKKQAFIVCPLIEESESESLSNIKAATVEFEKLKNTYFKKLKLGLLHGKMKPSEKDKVLSDFRNGKLTLLIATPVVEVGIDIPAATIMVIEAAERFGLASLHQIRGRVGRGSEKAYCLLFTESENEQALARIKLMETNSNGLKLAELDLGLRGPGQLAGVSQHGRFKLRFADITDLDLIKKAKEAVTISTNISAGVTGVSKDDLIGIN